MRFFPRRQKRADGAPSASQARAETTEHFRAFVASRVGVEAFLEPPTKLDPPTLVLVATTGEWTRRRVPDEKAARAVATALAIPIYDVNLTGYPSRMRQWSAQQRRTR